MAYILQLESSTAVCSVALSRDGKPVDLLEDTAGQNHARLMPVYADQILRKNGVNPAELAAVAVSAGPGSYTGLRIGVSLAKGICYANRVPLIAVSPLQALCAGVIADSSRLGIQLAETDRLVPMIDARRMEVYTATYSASNDELAPVTSRIVDEAAFAGELENHRLYFFGNGAAKCQAVIRHPNACFVPDRYTSAQFMCTLAYQSYRNGAFADLAYFEPFYLKDFIAGTPKKNILNR